MPGHRMASEGGGYAVFSGGKDLQPNTGTTDFAADKVIGILMIIFSICGAFVGLAALGIGGLATAVGASGGGGDAIAGGGMVMVVGILVLAISVARIYAGFKIFGAKRIGFMIGMITSLIAVVLALVSFSTQSIISIVISLALAYYCWGRMNGKIGPALAD